jgi:protein SCO1/2
VRRRVAAGGLLGLLGLLGLAVLLLAAGPRLLGAGGADAPVAIGGPFTLEDGTGAAVSDTAFRGRWMLVYFGYTHCPDACPTALNDMANALDLLGPQRRRVAPLFITVDPERDTPAVMRDYVQAFGAQIMGLTGTTAQVEAAEKQYRVYAAKHPTKDGGYDMDHSSIIYLMDPAGKFVAIFNNGTNPQEMAERMRTLI